MSSEIKVLTPSQIAFVKSYIPEFDPLQWVCSDAGVAGSERRFVRIRERVAELSGSRSFVLIIWNSADHDWDRFLNMEKELRSSISILPKIYQFDAAVGLILEEDLGATTVKAFCMNAQNDHQSVLNLYKHILDSTAAWHRLDPKLSTVVMSRSMDVEMFLWETSYFSEHCVTEYFGLQKELDSGWHEERMRLAAAAAGLPQVCMHRDFQSENILVTDGKVRFIDFQGARLGPAEYDIASLLFDPYIDCFSGREILDFYEYYCNVNPGTNRSVETFRLCALQRIMQALGAYANLSIHKGKEWYQAYIPVALGRLQGVLIDDKRFIAILRVVERCILSLEK